MNRLATILWVESVEDPRGFTGYVDASDLGWPPGDWENSFPVNVEIRLWTSPTIIVRKMGPDARGGYVYENTDPNRDRGYVVRVHVNND